MAEKENVELEQVPLKSDTDTPATEEKPKKEETVEEKKLEKSAGGKKWTFFSRTKKKEHVDEEGKAVEVTTTETTTTTTVTKGKGGTLQRFFAKKPKEQTDGTQPGDQPPCKMTIGINMLDRDERGINEHVKLSFEDIYGEPDTSHSWDCVWGLTYRIFTATRCFLYRLFALILAIPSALLFALIFALLTAINIFACVPLGRALTIPATWIAKVWNFVVRSLFDPCFRSCGLCLSSVTVRRYGISSDPTADLHAV